MVFNEKKTKFVIFGRTRVKECLFFNNFPLIPDDKVKDLVVTLHFDLKFSHHIKKEGYSSRIEKFWLKQQNFETTYMLA